MEPIKLFRQLLATIENLDPTGEERAWFAGTDAKPHQTKFEQHSMKLKIGVIASSKRQALSMLFLLSIIYEEDEDKVMYIYDGIEEHYYGQMTRNLAIEAVNKDPLLLVDVVGSWMEEFAKNYPIKGPYKTEYGSVWAKYTLVMDRYGVKFYTFADIKTRMTEMLDGLEQVADQFQ